MMLKPILLFTTAMLFTSLIYCQEKKDTIYFDEDWSVCEQPVAEYYRVCTLNRDKSIFYKGDVEDYYIDGKIEMTGHYADSGYKKGAFTFYNPLGKTIKKEVYLNDELNGDCFYYDSIGNLKAEFLCKSATDFTPIFLINANNDTLVKNGHGKFSFDSQKNLPQIFPLAEEYVVEGEVNDSMKIGEFDYYIKIKQGKPEFSEIYKNGKFIKAKSYEETIHRPLNFLHIINTKLDKTDIFYHSNLAFGMGVTGDQKVINFLLNHQSPEIKSSSQSFYDNDKIIFEVIGKVLQHDLFNIENVDISYTFSANPINVYYSFYTKKNQSRIIEGDIILTIDTNGHIISSAFNTTLTKSEIDKINYYLSRLQDLTPYQNNSQKFIANINLKLKTNRNTIEDSKESMVYIVYNVDSTKENLLADYTGVQVEAKFPGGMDAWRMYLERNLNNSVPADHRAPNGSYTVTVSFMVDDNGNISDVRAENDPGYGTAQEAVRVISKGPKWIPAIKDGKKVAYRQKQNFTFEVSSF